MNYKLFFSGVLISSFMLGLFLLFVPVTSAKPDNTIVVTTTNDIIANDSECALREAIIAANTDSAFNDCPAGNGADSITFDPALSLPAIFTITIAGANENASTTGDLDILGTLSITGSDPANIIFDGNDLDRVLDIRPGAHATISGVTVRNGTLVGSSEGGGIRVQASLTMSNSVVTDNFVGGIFNNGGGMVLTNVDVTHNNGGFGLQNLNQGSLTYNGGEVSGNQGVGISNATATAILSNLVITNNVGSGVSNSGATLSHLTLSHSSVISNTATNGGGVYNSGVGTNTTITQSTINNNTATVAGGGVYNNGTMSVNSSTLDHNHARSGGGIDHRGTTLHMTNTTISQNEASDNGGGFYNRGKASATLTHVTLSGNTANGADTGGNIFNDEASLTLQNSIVADADADGNCFFSGGFVTSSGNNLDDGTTCGFAHAGDMVNTDPLLGPLQDNGGSTLTHALLLGSPAIDMGSSAFCPSVDQRGVTRISNSCDIGAYEFDEVAETADLAISVSAPSLISINDVMTYTLSVINHGPATASSIVVTDTLPVEVTHLDSSMSGGGSCAYSTVVVCTLPAMASGTAVTVTIAVNTPAVNVMIVNHAEVSSATTDLQPSNNSDITETAVADLYHMYLPLVLRN